MDLSVMLNAAKRIKEYTSVISLQGRNMSEAMLRRLPWGSPSRNSKAYLVLSSAHLHQTSHVIFLSVTLSHQHRGGRSSGSRRRGEDERREIMRYFTIPRDSHLPWKVGRAFLFRISEKKNLYQSSLRVIRRMGFNNKKI